MKGAIKLWLKAIIWTAVFAVALFTLDRVLLGPRAALGWQVTEDFGQIPRAVGPVIVPRYLPESISWPPAEVFYSLPPEAGWWYELRAADDDEVIMWMGNTTTTLPDPIGDLVACLPGEPGTCPEGWHSLSAADDHDHTIYVITRIHSRELHRILSGLRHAHSSYWQ